MELKVADIHLPLRAPFTTAHGTLHAKHNLLVELHQDGFCGYGEAAPSLAYPAHNVEAVRASLESVRTLIARHHFTEPESFWNILSPHLDDAPFALCALDMAAHDLWGKQHHAPVWKLWGLELRNLSVSNYTIGLDSLEVMVAKLKAASNWPIFKIKLGSDHDLEIVRELRRHTNAPFRVDANTGWNPDDVLAFAEVLKTLGVEFIEQPLPPDQWQAMETFRGKSALPLIADESCQSLDDVPRCARAFDGINIKLTKAGGLTPARRMITTARQLGLRVMAGCMIESTVGISALAQLLPLLDDIDMDGAALLAEDIATGVTVTNGIAIFPDLPGNGVLCPNAPTVHSGNT